jgi:hypothetical protein
MPLMLPIKKKYDVFIFLCEIDSEQPQEISMKIISKKELTLLNFSV